jgi:hypothetical protein
MMWQLKQLERLAQLEPDLVASALEDLLQSHKALRKKLVIGAYLEGEISLAKSPTQTVVTQTNHFFAALCAFVKLELLQSSTHLNHFALKTKLYVAALHSAFDQLRQLQSVSLTA